MYFVVYEKMKNVAPLINWAKKFLEAKPSSFIKVTQSRNVFFKPTVLPKNERTNSVFFSPNFI